MERHTSKQINLGCALFDQRALNIPRFLPGSPFPSQEQRLRKGELERGSMANDEPTQGLCPNNWALRPFLLPPEREQATIDGQ